MERIANTEWSGCSDEKNSEQMFEGDSNRYSNDVSAEELRAAEIFLTSYRRGCRMLECLRYSRNYIRGSCLPEDPFNTDDEDQGDVLHDRVDETMLRAKLYSVRTFIQRLECDDNCAMLLYWHYIRGLTVTKCAEMLDISRSAAFRTRKRALEAAARALRTYSAAKNLADILP